MTVIELVEDVASRFEQAQIAFGQGTEDAFSESAWLILWCLNLPLDTDLESCEVVISGDALQRVNQLVEKRISSRQPLAYLTHEAWLQGYSFYVDERVIIPRSLISELLGEGAVLESCLPVEKIRKILDLCTGNASLAVLAALMYPNAKVVASDISHKALEVAKINVQKHHLEKQITLIEGDGLRVSAIKEESPFDLIICNPPYVNEVSMRALPKEFCEEPHVALAGGVDGMDFVRNLLQEAAFFLSEDGVLVLEIGNEIDYFEKAFPSLNPLWLETSAGDEQVLLLTKSQLSGA